MLHVELNMMSRSFAVEFIDGEGNIRRIFRRVAVVRDRISATRWIYDGDRRAVEDIIEQYENAAQIINIELPHWGVAKVTLQVGEFVQTFTVEGLDFVTIEGQLIEPRDGYVEEFIYKLFGIKNK